MSKDIDVIKQLIEHQKKPLRHRNILYQRNKNKPYLYGRWHSRLHKVQLREWEVGNDNNGQV